ncbi:galactokinase family protein [Poriferisphaera sp. WC338]|uniref:GHMP family kinase ATP-binding protein n=1 Tax=Poriferisphaera sp. WC338 TaxID=3425129 RepID=UPI003D81501A
MQPHEALNKGVLFEQGTHVLRREGVTINDRTACYFIPGRLEFLGKHTDYCGGRSLLCTVERGLCFVVQPREDNMIRMILTESGETCSFSIHSDLQPKEGAWSNYPMTVARRLARNFSGPHRGADIAFASDLPQAAGMSSSSAIVVGMWMILNDINHYDQTDVFQQNIRSQDDLAGYLGCHENGQSFRSLEGDKGVGTFGGSQDHTAILFSQPKAIVQYGFCPVHHEATIPFDNEQTIIIGTCGVMAEKTRDAKEKYNKASLLARQLISLWHEHVGQKEETLAAIVRSKPNAQQQLHEVISSRSIDDTKKIALIARLDQFCEESEVIIPTVSRLLEKNGATQIGKYVDRSQFLTTHLLKNQIPQTTYLATSARKLGATAASAFGAGFGGSVWAMVPEDRAKSFMQQWREDYTTHEPRVSQDAIFFMTHAGPAATRLI